MTTAPAVAPQAVTGTSTSDPLCSCRSTAHEALCPANPDPSVCDGCGTAYDPDAVDARLDCPGGHCPDDACLCWACVRTYPYGAPA